MTVPPETPRGAEAVDEIAAIDGIDVLWLGHFDMTNFMGIPGQFTHPDFLAAVDRIVAAAQRHGKTAGFMQADESWARDYVAKGFRIHAYGVDYEIPLKYGVDQCIGDTLGPGGIFRGQRHIPVLVEIAKDMEAVAKPGAAPFELPFIVQGSWNDPIMLPDPEALIQRSGAAAALLNAVRDRRARDAVRSAIERLTGGAPAGTAVPAVEHAPDQAQKP